MHGGQLADDRSHSLAPLARHVTVEHTSAAITAGVDAITANATKATSRRGRLL